MINAPVRRGLYLDNGFSLRPSQNKVKYQFSTIMAKSLSPVERVADKLTAITTAVEALFKHTNKAISLRNKASRTT